MNDYENHNKDYKDADMTLLVLTMSIAVVVGCLYLTV